ncbi:MAG: DUF1549 and DUF1553 domain-containing protein [Planctomycetota bacterium]|nr:DUF1549 and DUF1553 domain-containing protein [Planctomycetota bacterium]
MNCLCLLLCAVAPLPGDIPPVSFRDQVMPLLSQAGCNSGPCHGNLNGKGGFKLSLRGEDPAHDWRALTHGELGRRVDSLAPVQSLLLQKSSGQIPHEGGVRWAAEGPAWNLARLWISQGCLPDAPGAPRVISLRVDPAEVVMPPAGGTITPRVTAQFDDGSSRQVGHLATLEPSDPAMLARVEAGQPALYSPARANGAVLVRYGPAQASLRVWSAQGPAIPAQPASHPVDRIIQQRLASLGITPVGGVDDGRFLRRLWLDLAGQLPPADRVRQFLANPDPAKRAHEADYLLAQPSFADVWALHWADLLRVEEKTLDARGVRAMHGWLRRAFLDGMPLDQLARELVTARGSTYEHPPANFYRALRDTQARAEAVAQVFMGVRIACARCHNHPFDHWTTDDYNALSAVFENIHYRVLENKRGDDLDKHEFKGEQVVFLWPGDSLHSSNPAAAKKAIRKPEQPKARLPGETTFLSQADRPQAMADWLTAPGNPYFAKAQANRVWRRLMGRGLVEPEDDFRLANPASHPGLLAHLATELVTSGYDLRALTRHIVLSEAYSRGPQTDPRATADDGLLAATLPRQLGAEQLLDAWASVLQAPLRHAGHPAGTRTLELAGMASQKRGKRADDMDRFLRAFGKPERLLSCDCERTAEPTLAQTLMLTSGQLPHRLLTDSSRLDRLANAEPARAVEELYLAALTRLPSAREATDCARLLTDGPDRRLVLEDLAWALLGCREFLLRW